MNSLIKYISAGLMLLIGVALNARAQENCKIESIEQLGGDSSLDAPCCMLISLKNTSGNKLWIRRDSRFQFIYAEFECKDIRVRKQKEKLDDINSATRRIGYVWKEWPVNAAIRSIIYPNKSLVFQKGGEFHIKYDINLYISTTPDADVRNCEKTHVEGTTEIKIVDSKVKDLEIEKLTAAWDGSGTLAFNIIQGLGYVENDNVIPYILKLGLSYPIIIPDAARALEKYSSMEDGKIALESLGSPFSINEAFLYEGRYECKEDYAKNALTSVLYAFSHTQNKPSEKFIISQLRDKSEARVLLTLNYLKKLEGKSIVDDKHLRWLLSSDNELIRESASKVLEKLPKKEFSGNSEF